MGPKRTQVLYIVRNCFIFNDYDVDITYDNRGDISKKVIINLAMFLFADLAERILQYLSNLNGFSPQCIFIRRMDVVFEIIYVLGFICFVACGSKSFCNKRKLSFILVQNLEINENH